MGILKYSVLMYMPSIIRDEKINIGIAIHDLEKMSVKFTPITNVRRVLNFDDELTKDELIFMLNSFKHSFSQEFSLINKFNENFLEDNTKYYVNNYRFGSVGRYQFDNFKEGSEQLIKLYLHYDHPKDKRLKDPDIAKILKNKVDASLENANISGKDLIKFGKSSINGSGYDGTAEFKVKDRYLKVFNLNKSDEDRRNVKTSYLKMAKEWVYNANYIQGNLDFIVFEEENSEINKHFISILGKAEKSKIINFDQAEDYIIELSSKN